jgi:hypothetical protein
VLFHVTANSDWSNLPLSGLFVEMLRRAVALGPSQIALEGGKRRQAKLVPWPRPPPRPARRPLQPSTASAS